MVGNKNLTVECITSASDTLTMRRRDVDADGMVSVRMAVRDQHSLVILSEEDARRMFNWLGVQLHAR